MYQQSSCAIPVQSQVRLFLGCSCLQVEAALGYLSDCKQIEAGSFPRFFVDTRSSQQGEMSNLIRVLRMPGHETLLAVLPGEEQNNNLQPFNGSSGTSVRIAVMNQPCTVPTLPGSDAVHPPMKTCRPRLQGPTPRVRIGESKLASGMRFAPCPMAVLLSILVHAAELPKFGFGLWE